MNHFDYVILGGGLAGLCAAKHLLEMGICPLVIEGGSYPAHKVCGEFLSPSSLPLLQKWNLHPIPIHQVQWHTASKNLQIHFRYPAGSLSHLTLDSQLAGQISKQGASLFTQTQVIDLTPSSQEGDFHQLTLSTGKIISAKHLLIATGRLPHHSQKTMIPRYRGFKSHFSGLDLNSTLHMFSFQGAYLGIVPVENGRSNLACLAKIERVQQFSSSHEFMQSLVEAHPLLRQLLASGTPLFERWMEASVPEFQVRSTPNWPQTYWIGDAAGTIPPASGNGLSLAIASGYLAAEFAARNDPQGFKRLWKKRCATQIRLAKGLHHLFLNPAFGGAAMQFSHWLPSLAQRMFEFTRDPGIKIQLNVSSK